MFRYILLVGVMVIGFVNLNAQTNITIAVQTGSNDTICSNGNTQLIAIVTNCASPTYQWYKNGVAITSGGTGQTISLNATTDVSNGDTITCRQTNTTAPCSLDTSNRIRIFFKANQALSWINTSGSVNQTICQFNPITPIKFQVTGATNATVGGLPTGVTGSYSNGVYTISGTPTQSGSFGYQVQTQGTGLCGSTAQTGGTLTVKNGGLSLLTNAGQTQYIVFNGVNYFIRCVPTTNANISLSNATTNSGSISTYKVKWGDGTLDTTFTSFNSNIIHNYGSGFYQLTFTTTSVDGCISTVNYGIFVGNSPQGNLGNPGTLSGCGPLVKTFPISGTNINVPGTTYFIQFGDGTDTTFTHPNIPSSITHSYTKSSCGFNMASSNPNSFTATMTIANPCFPNATPTVGPIVVSTSPKPNIAIDKNKICVNENIIIKDSSEKGNYIDVTGCKSGSSTYWTITPSTGWNTVSNLGNNGGQPNDIDFWTNGDNALNVTFTQPGTYTISLFNANNCNPNSPGQKDTTICVNPTPVSSFTIPKDTLCAGENLTFTSTSNTPLCGNNTYQWSVSKTDINGCVAAIAPTFVTPTSASSANPILIFSKPGTYVVSLTTTIQGTSCTSTPFKDTIIVKDKPTNVSIALSRPTICQGDTVTPTVTASCFTNNATYSWTFTNGNSASSSIKNPGGVIFNTAGSNNIAVDVTNSCGNTSQSTSVSVLASPTLTATAVNATICNGQNATINLTSNQTGIKYSWTSTVTSGAASGNSNQSTATSTTSINNTLANTGSVDAVVRYTITVVGAPTTNCVGETKTVDITVRPGITAANAGTDQNLCDVTTVTLAGNNPTVGTGTWTKISGPAATITNAAVNNTTVTGLQYGVYLFVWTISGSGGGSCATSSDTVQIINRPIITTASAGSDVIVCNFLTPTNSITLQGNTAIPSRSYETGTWTIVAKPSGSNASFSDANNPTSTFTFNQTGNYTLAWTITNDINCTPTTDSVLIKVYQAAVGGTTNSNATVCKSNNAGTITLTGFTGNIVKWQYKVSGSGSWVDIANTTSSLSYSNLDTTTTYQAIIATTNTTDCPITAASSQTTITVNPVPVISNLTATSPTQCSTANGTISFNVVPVSGSYDINYTKGGVSQTVNINVNPVGGVITINNLGAGTYSNIFVTLSNCPSNSIGSYTLVDPNPPATPTIVGVDSICSGKNLTLNAATPITNAIYTWTNPNGDTLSANTYTLNNIATKDFGVYKLFVTLNLCKSKDTTINIRVDSTPIAPTLLANPVCTDSTIKLFITNNYPMAVNYNWTGINGFTSTQQNPTIINATLTMIGGYNAYATSVVGKCQSQIATTNVLINETPHINFISIKNPDQCATASGNIQLSGLNSNTSYIITYTVGGNTLSQTQTSNGTGILKIDTLRAGTYSNIFVKLTNCPSNSIGSYTLVDPNPPATPTIVGVDSICSGKNLTLNPATPITNAIYTWTNPNGDTLSANTYTLNNIATKDFGVYKLFVTLNLCKSKDTTINIRVDSTPIAPTLLANPVCTDSTIKLFITNNYPMAVNYNWTGINGFTSTQQNPTIINATLTMIGGYNAYATSVVGQCQSTTSTINVVVNESPNVAPMSDTTYKDGSNSGNLFFAGTVANTTFNWINTNPSIGLLASGTGTINFNATNTTPFVISGQITVTPSTQFCLGLPISFNIFVNPTPTLTSPLKDTICTDVFYSYQATSSTPNVKYTWSRNNVLGISNSAATSIDSSGLMNETLINTTSLPIDVIYEFKLYALGSVNTVPFSLTVNPDAKAIYTFTNDKLCTPAFIDTFNIKAQDFSVADISYEWYVNNTLIGTGIHFPGYNIVNNGDTVYIKLKAISAFGCKADSFEHKFYTVKTPSVSFTKSIDKGCGPLTVSFTNISTPLTAPTYYWDFGDGQTSSQPTPPLITFNADTSYNRNDTIYYIKLIAITQCDTIKFTDSVTVFPKPKALFQPDTTVGCSIFHFAAFNNSLGTHNTYTWDFGDSTAIVIDTLGGYIYHNFFTAKTDTFTIKLIARNACGVDSAAVKVVVFPNTIVPKIIVDGNNNFGCAPSQIRFVNNTIGASKFTMNFGDGSLPYLSNKNPDTVYHTYNTGGNFVVTLKAENSCTDSTVSLTLQLFDKPKALFSLASNKFCKKEIIHFKNLSDSTLSFEWRFGDGGTSTNLHPNYAYNNAGNYLVTLIVKSTNITGSICSDTIRKNITIHDLPTSSFTNNAAIQNCQPYYFVGLANLLPNEIGNWTFFDAFSNDTTQAGNVGVHSFKQTGIYNVRLVVFNIHGCSDTSSTSVKVIETPKAKFSISDTISCVPGKTVSCTNLTTYLSPDAVNYQWYVNGVLQATTKDFVYNFAAATTITTAANFVVKLVTINSYGCRDSATKLFVIYPKAQPAFAINANIGCVPFNLQFNNTTQYANIFNWYLNGQLFSNAAAPSPITLTIPATNYDIKLVASHTLGCGADSVSKQFTSYTKPVADFNIPNKNSCTGILNIQCFDLSSVVGATITKWNWIFGDGATDIVKNPTHTYTTAGHFNVGLVATDNRGCKSDITYQTVANFGKPKANFTFGNVCVRNPLIPISLSTPGLGSTAITNYLWNFGDGNYLTGAQPIYVYQNEGNYTITLIVTSDSSCVADTLQKTVTVYGKPTADFKFENNCVKENTLFTNTSLTGFGQSLIGNSKWTFGDGGTSNSFNATHIFNATGNYVVQLAVSGNRCPNLFDSITKVVTVYKPRDPVIYPRIEGVRGTPVQLAALSGGFQYNWTPITGLDNAGIQNPIGNYTIAHPNIINYNIRITDSLGCKVNDKQEVWLFADADVFVPTAFTPNGDGANDILKPLYINISRIQHFRIFDRWGKVVFETSDMGKAWDGKLNGNDLPLETYTWTIIAITQQGKEISKKGNVTLIRN